jgi:hypothetical protein
MDKLDIEPIFLRGMKMNQHLFDFLRHVFLSRSYHVFEPSGAISSYEVLIR